MRYRFLLFGLAFWVAACGSPPRVDELSVTTGTELYAFDFEAQGSFETGRFPESGAELSIRDGRYYAHQEADRAAYIWGQGGEKSADVIIVADTVAQTDFEDMFFGLMCRVDEKGAGYAFLISVDGFAGIARTDGKSMVFLRDWVQTGAIHTGKADNSLKAICAGGYLALYVNDELVANVRDSRYQEPGQIGLLTGIIADGQAVREALAAFDDVVVSEAIWEQAD